MKFHLLSIFPEFFEGPFRHGVVARAAQAGALEIHIHDLRNWTPTAPTMLCGGDQDPVVFYANTQLMQTYWATYAPAATTISVLDLDSSTPSTGENGSLQSEFQDAKRAVAAAAVLQGATDGGQTAVFEAYHATLVAPFCLAAVAHFFDMQ